MSRVEKSARKKSCFFEKKLFQFCKHLLSVSEKVRERGKGDVGKKSREKVEKLSLASKCVQMLSRFVCGRYGVTTFEQSSFGFCSLCVCVWACALCSSRMRKKLCFARALIVWIMRPQRARNHWARVVGIAINHYAISPWVNLAAVGPRSVVVAAVVVVGRWTSAGRWLRASTVSCFVCDCRHTHTRTKLALLTT